MKPQRAPNRSVRARERQNASISQADANAGVLATRHADDDGCGPVHVIERQTCRLQGLLPGRHLRLQRLRRLAPIGFCRVALGFDALRRLG